MKLNPRKFSIMALALVFLVFAAYCCCLPQAAEATKVQSCHQDQEQKSEQHNDECCQKPPVLTANKAFLLETFVISVLIDFSKTLQHPTVAYPIQNSSQSFLDTSPLYLKYSVLRI